jgi:hypothetical protein
MVGQQRLNSSYGQMNLVFLTKLPDDIRYWAYQMTQTDWLNQESDDQVGVN